jgi:hypothetical protein
MCGIFRRPGKPSDKKFVSIESKEMSSYWTGKFSMTTFVSAILKAYPADVTAVKQFDVRLHHFKKLATIGIPVYLFVDPDYVSALTPLLEKYPHIHIFRVLRLEETRTYSLFAEQKDRLPAIRNVEKDTFEFLTLMNAKIEFMADVAAVNPERTEQFAWIDFNVFHVFQNLPVQMERLRRIAKGQIVDDRILMPSCWRAGYCSSELWSKINWRFCGGFFQGTRNAILDLDSRLSAVLPDWIRANGITWEVNVWSHLENTTDWRPRTYPADHNDRLIYVPPEFFSNWEEIRTQECLLNDTATCLQLHPSAQVSNAPLVPSLEGFQPSSSSFVNWKGQPLLNVRYVNYELTPQGAYIIHHPEHHLVTRNILFPLDPTTFKLKGEGQEMESSVGLVSHGGTIYGLEDVRLFTGKDGAQRFIATQRQYVPQLVNRMMVGDVDTETHRFVNGQILEPPRPTGCEKNWIPLPVNADGKERFVYSWSPYTVGGVNEKGEFQVEMSREMPPFFERIRGSTVPMEIDGLLWLIVHYSQETCPRTYFHALVQLDPVTYIPLRRSQPFVFGRLGIEFCIGFTVEEGRHLRFWFSQHDKDLATLRVSTEAFVWTNIV